MQILFPTFFKTCAEDALSRPKANSASLDEQAGSKSEAGLRTQLTRRVEPASTDGAGSRSGAGLRAQMTLRAESAPRSRADSKNGVGFDERSPLQRAESARGARLVSGQCLLQRTKPALAKKGNTNKSLPCTGMSRRAGQNKRQTSYSPAFSLWRMRMIETA